MRRTVAALAALVVLALAAGCSSAGPHSHRSDAGQTGAGGSAVLAGQSQSAGPGRNAVRLGFVAAAADGIALVGVQDGLFREDLGAGTKLDPVRLASSQAAEQALERG